MFKLRWPHQHDKEHEHEHAHGVTDPLILTSQRGIWAVKWSFIILMATAVFQVAVIVFTGSVALLADTVHNFGDALTSVPLWIAFRLGRRKPTRRFTYGYGRVEDLAGLFIVFALLGSAAFAGYESVDRIFHPRDVEYLWVVMAASIIGFIGNEAVAVFRIRVGKEISSAALVADGHHARVDGLTSLGVLLGALGVWLGIPRADPIMGLIITAVILRIVWMAGSSVFTRLIDGVDPQVIDDIEHASLRVPGVKEITAVKVRWLGHRMHAELDITVCADLSVEEGHHIACNVRHELLHNLKYLSDATIHVDPEQASGQDYHCVENHEHDGLPTHSHVRRL
jgi:cation diffusion facilitator family transporter